MEWRWVVTAVLGLGVAVLMVLGQQLWKAFTAKRAPDYDVEDYFQDEAGVWHKFEGLDADATKTVSIIVPAYKEESRIPPMMDDMLAYLTTGMKAGPEFTWEILVVDDGSTDKTSQVVYDRYVKTQGADRVRLLTLHRNNGKGGAVRKGMVRARGKYLLMADADGATAAAEVGKVLRALQSVERDGLGIAVGSRAHLEDAGSGDAKARRTPLRKFLMWGFHTLITIMIGNSHIRDTQCGFKLFTRPTARLLFPVQHIDRWAFDVELLYLAGKHGVPMVEVPVTWNEVEGSKLDVLTSTIQMTRDIIAIRMCYLFGLWKSTPTPTTPEVTGKLSSMLAAAASSAGHAGRLTTPKSSAGRSRSPGFSAASPPTRRGAASPSASAQHSSGHTAPA